MFDLDSDPILIGEKFKTNKKLYSLWKKNPGLRIVKSWDIFEQAICTILGQLVSVKQGRSLVKQLVEGHGETVVHPITGEKLKLFPTPLTLSKANLKLVQTTQKRKDTIKEFSKKVASGKFDLDPSNDFMRLRDSFLEIKGIGVWTADYIGLRAYGDVDTFPKTDLILKRSLEKHVDLNLEMIRPWRSYVAIYFWKHYANTLSKKKVKK